jgi:hypothetical protein
VSNLQSIYKLLPTELEKRDGINPLSVAQRSMVDAAMRSPNRTYRRAVLPYLNLFTRSSTSYRDAKLVLDQKNGFLSCLDVLVERIGPEVASSVLISGSHKITTHNDKTKKSKCSESVEGVILEAWNTADSSLDLTTLYANGITRVRERYGNMPVYAVERVQSPDEKPSRFMSKAFDPSVVKAIEGASFRPVFTGYITRDDMRGMNPVYANVYTV